MILLHGGLTLEMISGLIGGFVGASVLFIGLIIYGIKRRNRGELSNLDTSQKFLVYIIFVFGAAIISFVSFYFLMFLFGWITSLVT